jgi:hypothetical protein
MNSLRNIRSETLAAMSHLCWLLNTNVYFFFSRETGH